MRDDSCRRLADLEIEHHRNDLLYADRQAIRKGEYHAVIARIRRRKYLSLCLTAAGCALLVVLGGALKRITGLVLLGIAVNEYVQAKRTEETIRHLFEELDRRAP